MSQKSILLKELGWNDALIKHYMIEDSDNIEHNDRELILDVCDTHSITINYNTQSSGTSVILVLNSVKDVI